MKVAIWFFIYIFTYRMVGFVKIDKMKTLDKIVKIPAFLHELHGEQASIFDLLITYLTAIVVTIVVLFLARDTPLENYKLIILGILAFDLSGGVIANFTQSTNTYYAKNLKLRYVFILFHVVQPLVLMWLFPMNLIGIAFISVYTLLAIFLVNFIKEHLKQRVSSAFLVVIGLSIIFLFVKMQPTVYLMLVLYVIKLIMGFAVIWK